MEYLLLHVAILFLLTLPNGRWRTQDGHLIQMEDLLAQAILEVLVHLAAESQDRPLVEKKLANLEKKKKKDIILLS